MQMRVSNHHPSGPGPFTSAITHPVRRHKQQAIFTYHGKETPQNIYYDMNPYLLQLAPSQQPRRPFISRSRNSTQSKELSDRSSHRSLKVIRVNGLREVEKPKLTRQVDQHSLRSSRGNEQSRRFGDREAELESENKALKAEQEMLKEKIRGFEVGKEEERRVLQQKIMQLIEKVIRLQQKVERGEQQWRYRSSKLSSHHGHV